MTKISTATILASALVFAGCAVDDIEPVEDQVVSAGNPIINGDPATAAHHDSVVSLHYNGSSNIFCSGTLIAADVVLTAAHCLDDAKGGPNYKTMDPGLLTVYFGSNPTDGSYAGNNIQAIETSIYPTYSRWALTDDIALVRLASDGPVAPSGYEGQGGSGGLTAGDLGSDLDFVGFGYSVAGDRNYINEKLHAVDTLDAFGCQVTGCGSWGDDPDVIDTQISYAQAGTGPCNGDSGGPAFILRGTDYRVAGVTSYGDADCAVYGASTRVGAFGGWIDDFVNAAPPPTCTPEPENCSDGVDNDCDGDVDGADSDCSTNSCNLGQVGDSCTFAEDCCSNKCKGRTGAKTCK
jgi:secreted trypsin-like serine protease